MSKQHLAKKHAQLLELGRAVIATESAALDKLIERINEDFLAACLAILECRGRLVVLGIGKSGHIGKKIAATFSSTGTPAFFVHPSEASHGDLGTIQDDDVVLVLSNSGETAEITTLLPIIKRLGVVLISFTGNSDSSLAKIASINIDVSVEKEACPLGLAPTASTTAALVMGDAMAIALLEMRGFSKEDFASAHPGGTLGRRLLLRVDDIMHVGAQLPTVLADTLLSETLLVMTQGGLGVATIVDQKKHLLGIFTDGDLRRVLDDAIDVHKISVGQVMSKECKTIDKDCLAAEALAMMEKYRFNALPVVSVENKLIGVLNMHDLLRARVI